MMFRTMPMLAGALMLAVGHQGDAREIAITIDDLPYAMPDRLSSEEGLAAVKSVNHALAAYDIDAVGFVIAGKVNDQTLPALSAFLEAGHIIGNHSWSHPDLNEMTPAEFREETSKAHDALAKWMPSTLFYRYPYLRQGDTPEKRDAISDILVELGYRNVPVSIDNDEWIYNADYMKALAEGDQDEAAKVAALYLEHMRERTSHFQALSQKKLGRDVKHILLIHMNKINADHLDALLEQYAGDGWKFISVEDALSDPVYNAKDEYAGPRGLSQLERVNDVD